MSDAVVNTADGFICVKHHSHTMYKTEHVIIALIPV